MARNITDSTKIAAALAALHRLIAAPDSLEFSDAQFRISQEHGVNYEALADAYDADQADNVKAAELRAALAEINPYPRDCPDCNGTGADPVKTAKARKTGACDSRSYIRCWNCNGNGLNPMHFFRFS